MCHVHAVLIVYIIKDVIDVFFARGDDVCNVLQVFDDAYRSRNEYWIYKGKVILITVFTHIFSMRLSSMWLFQVEQSQSIYSTFRLRVKPK